MSSSDAELLVSIHRRLLRAEDAAGSEWDLEKHQNLEPGVKGAGEAGVMLLSRAHMLLSSIHGRSVSPEVQARLFWGRREQMPERLGNAGLNQLPETGFFSGGFSDPCITSL